jgi:hypothetical protein
MEHHYYFLGTLVSRQQQEQLMGVLQDEMQQTSEQMTPE